MIRWLKMLFQRRTIVEVERDQDDKSPRRPLIKLHVRCGKKEFRQSVERGDVIFVQLPFDWLHVDKRQADQEINSLRAEVAELKRRITLVNGELRWAEMAKQSLQRELDELRETEPGKVLKPKISDFDLAVNDMAKECRVERMRRKDCVVDFYESSCPDCGWWWINGRRCWCGKSRPDKP